MPSFLASENLNSHQAFQSDQWMTSVQTQSGCPFFSESHEDQNFHARTPSYGTWQSWFFFQFSKQMGNRTNQKVSGLEKQVPAHSRGLCWGLNQAVFGDRRTFLRLSWRDRVRSIHKEELWGDYHNFLVLWEIWEISLSPLKMCCSPWLITSWHSPRTHFSEGALKCV